MLQSRWVRRSAVVFAAMLVSLVGLATPAPADAPEIQVTFTPHCSNNLLKFTNPLSTAIEVRGVVEGTPTAWTTVNTTPRTVAVHGEPGDEVEAQFRIPPNTTIVTQETTYTYTVPDRCDDFAVTFTDSCDSTTVSVTNNHGAEVYLRIYAPVGTPVYDDGDDDGGDPTDYFQDGENFTGTFPMSAGDEMSVEISFLDSRLIDTVAKHAFVATGCEPDPEYPTTIEDTCAGVKITVSNDSDEAFTAEVIRSGTPSESLLEFEVAAGETKTVEVAVEDGAAILVSSGDLKRDLARHTVDLKDCPDLPKTGTDVTTLALVGLGVLIVGAGVLFGLHLRRRKLTQQ